MAESASGERRQQRGRAREQRRSLAAEPFERVDEAARNEKQQQGGTRGGDTLNQVAATAVAGAVAAGIAGAAKAIRDRGADETGDSAPRRDTGDPPSEKSEADSTEDD